MEPYKIIECSGYLEIVIDRDMLRPAVIATYLALSERTSFPTDNVLWHVQYDIQPLSYRDIQDIVSITKSSFPLDAPKSKDAFVCESAFLRAAATLYALETAPLPFEVKVFDNYDKAVAWLTTADD